jgi:hypothetical protein
VKSVVAYHARRLGVAADDRFARRYDWTEIQRAYDSGLSVRGCAEQFGFTLASWHKAVKRGDVLARPRSMPIEDLLVADRLENISFLCGNCHSQTDSYGGLNGHRRSKAA